MKTSKTNETLLVSILLVIILLIFLIVKTNSEYSTFKCPKEYKTEEEYLNDMDIWINTEYTANPNVTEEEMKEKRSTLFKNHKCEQGDWIDNTQTINGTPLPIQEIVLTDTEKNDLKTYTSDLGFSFKYPSNVSVEILPKFENEDTERIIIRSNSKDENSIIISIANNNENLSAEDWLLGPTSGFAPSDEYYTATIDGQDIVYTDNGMWVVVNTPDNKYRLSIADLTIDSSVRLIREMNIVVTSLIFK